MKIKVEKLWLEPEEVSNILVENILKTQEEINIYSPGDFYHKFQSEAVFPEIRLGETEVEIVVEVKGAIYGEITNDRAGDEPDYYRITERRLSGNATITCFLDGQETPFNADDIYSLIDQKVKI
jgi:hypothetical protein